MSRPSYTKDQRDRAKRMGWPLVTISYDGRHVAKGRAGRTGFMSFTGPLHPAQLEKVQRFLTDLIRERVKLMDGEPAAAAEGRVG